jgi:hypothetical protein
MEAEEAKLRAIVDNDEFVEIFNNLSKFRVKLLGVAEDYEVKIHNQK